MDVKEKATRDFKRLNDLIEKASKTADYEFEWHYEDIAIKYNNKDNMIINLGELKQFHVLSVGEVNLLLRSLLKIYDLENRGLCNEVFIIPFLEWSNQIKRIQAYLNSWRVYNENDSYRMNLDNVKVESVNDIINVLILTIHHVIYTEGEYWKRKTRVEDNSMEVDDISEFYDKWFVAHQEYMNEDTPYEVKLFKNDNEYLKINASQVPERGRKYIRVMMYNPLDFNVTPDEFNKLLFMLSVIYNWEDRKLGRYVTQYFTPIIDFLKKSRGYLIGEDYCQLFDSYYDNIKAIYEDEFLHDDIARWLNDISGAWDMLTDQLANKQSKEVEEDNVHTYTSVFPFCWDFYTYQEDFGNNSESFKIMLFSEDNSTKYISIKVNKNNNVNVTFHETPREIELGDVVQIVKVMRTLMQKSYDTLEYGVDFNYVSLPDAMLAYVKDLLGNTPAKYKDCYIKYEELEEAEDKNLYKLYKNADTFLGKWLDFVAKWEEDQQTDQRPRVQSGSNNYYTDSNGQDMFAKFEALDDFREQRYALGFCYHNVEKYLIRAGRKTDDPTEDINKALNYLHEYRKLEKIYFE